MDLRGSFFKHVLVHAVRRYENAVLLDDRRINRQACHAATDSESFLIKRAILIADRTGLSRTVTLAKEYLLVAWIFFALTIVALTYFLLSSVLPDSREINPILFLIALLAPHIWSLSIWVAVMLRQGQGSGFTRYGFFIASKIPMPGDKKNKLVFRAIVDAASSVRKLPDWFASMINHAIWTLSFLVLILVILLLFSFSEYHFTVETTILTSGQFEFIVNALGGLPEMMGFPSPLLESGVSVGADQDMVSKEWGYWILGCATAYGFLPRLLLLLFSAVKVRMLVGQIGIIESSPYTKSLLNIFEDCKKPDSDVSPGTSRTLVVFIEVDGRSGLPLRQKLQESLESAEIIIFDVQDVINDSVQLLTKIKIARPTKTLVVADFAREDRELAQLMKKIRFFSSSMRWIRTGVVIGTANSSVEAMSSMVPEEEIKTLHRALDWVTQIKEAQSEVPEKNVEPLEEGLFPEQKISPREQLRSAFTRRNNRKGKARQSKQTPIEGRYYNPVKKTKSGFWSTTFKILFFPFKVLIWILLGLTFPVRKLFKR